MSSTVDLHARFANPLTSAQDSTSRDWSWRRCACRIPSPRLAVPFDEVEFKTETVVFGPVKLPVTWDEVLPAE